VYKVLVIRYLIMRYIICKALYILLSVVSFVCSLIVFHIVTLHLCSFTNSPLYNGIIISLRQLSGSHWNNRNLRILPL